MIDEGSDTQTIEAPITSIPRTNSGYLCVRRSVLSRRKNV